MTAFRITRRRITLEIDIRHLWLGVNVVRWDRVRQRSLRTDMYEFPLLWWKPRGHLLNAGWCAKPDEHYSNCVCGSGGSIVLPGRCYCDRDVPEHFTDPGKAIAEALDVTIRDRPGELPVSLNRE